MTTLFITSSGTGIGKTLMTCALVHQLRGRDLSVRAIKPVVSGFDASQPDESDCALLLKAQEGSPAEELDEVSPWRFRAPLSPDMAAAAEGRRVPFGELLDFCRAATTSHDHLIIEGVGGVMAPLDERHTVLDWIAALDATALVVVGSYLGTISHTLTACAALRARRIHIQGVIVSESQQDAVDLISTCRVIERFQPDIAVTPVARVGGPQPWRDVPDLLSVAGFAKG